MLTGIYGNQYITATSPSNPYISPGQSAGMVRYNTNNNSMEVYNGTSWIVVGGSASIDLTSYSREAIDWVHSRIKEEHEWRELAKENAAVQAAVDAVRTAEEQLRITAILAKEHK